MSQQQSTPTKILFKSKNRKSVREKVARYQGKRNVFKSFFKDSKLRLRRKATGRKFHTDAEAQANERRPFSELIRGMDSIFFPEERRFESGNKFKY